MPMLKANTLSGHNKTAIRKERLKKMQDIIDNQAEEIKQLNAEIKELKRVWRN